MAVKNIYIKASKQSLKDELENNYEAYVISSREYRTAPKVGVSGAQDIIHLVSSDAAEIADLQASLDYIGDSLTDIAIRDYDTFCQIAECVIEEEMEGRKVPVRIKAAEWITRGKPPIIKTGICHQYLGVDPEVIELDVKEISK